MKTALTLLFASLLWAARLQAGDIKFEALVAKDAESVPTTWFSSDVSQVMAFFHSTGTHQGDKIRAVWIADDIGEAAPKGATIVESVVTADKDNAVGGFKLSKPTKGWPLGKYEIDIYDGDQLETTVKFTIGADDPRKDAASDDESDG